MSLSRTKRTVLLAVGAAALLAGGAAVWAVTSDDGLSSEEFDRASAAALREVGEGKVTDADADDDARPRVYEVEVTRPDGREVDVVLDEDFAVIGAPTGDAGAATGPSTGSGTGSDDAPDPVVSADQRAQAEAAALEAVGGGTAVDVEADDDPGEAAYDVEVRADDGTSWNVELDERFAVVSKQQDD